MNDDQLDAARVRLGEVQATLNAMDGVWPHIARELGRDRLRKMDALVVAEDQELRGRIKQIDDLLLLPQYLRMEIQTLSGALPK